MKLNAGPNSEFFTIRMHHSGKFMNFGSTCYVGGSISYFDYCSEDEMSMLEISEMAKDLGLHGSVSFFHNRGGGINNCNSVVLMNDDVDAMILVNFLDRERVTEIYVGHGDNNLSEDKSENGENESMGGSFPEVDEPVGYEGDDEQFDDEVYEPSHFNEPSIEPDEPSQLNEDILDLNDSGGSDVQSVGQDSEHSDYLVDSEFYESDDDFNYDQHVDFDAEWGGLRENTSEALELRKSRRTNAVVDVSEGTTKPKKSQFTHNKFPVFNPNVDMVDPQFELGLCFFDAATFRSDVRQHSIVQGRAIKFQKNEKNKVEVVCKHKSCPWKVYASYYRKEATFQIKTLHAIHDCNRKERVTSATTKWLANKYSDKIISDPNWPVNSMLTVVQKDCKLLFSKWQMYRAKRKAKEQNSRTTLEQYGLMWNYASEIVRTNPGTTVKIKSKAVGDDLKFKRFYLCWGALKKGFLDGCRPIIFLDGCHLKSGYGGILLCAVGIDASNGMYPFAYAVVEKEKKESWLWFIELLKTDL